jgi:hypothetical protein
MISYLFALARGAQVKIRALLFSLSLVAFLTPTICFAQRFVGPEGLVFDPANNNNLWVANSETLIR